MVDEDDTAAADIDAKVAEVAKADNFDSHIVAVVEEYDETIVDYDLLTFSDLPV